MILIEVDRFFSHEKHEKMKNDDKKSAEKINSLPIFCL